MPIGNRRDHDANENIMNELILLPCLDSEERAARCRAVLDIPRARAAELDGRTSMSRIINVISISWAIFRLLLITPHSATWVSTRKSGS
jgi:hypothetical protein